MKRVILSIAVMTAIAMADPAGNVPFNPNAPITTPPNPVTCPEEPVIVPPVIVVPKPIAPPCEKGDKGDKGDIGERGYIGYTGSSGVDGIDGVVDYTAMNEFIEQGNSDIAEYITNGNRAIKEYGIHINDMAEYQARTTAGNVALANTDFVDSSLGWHGAAGLGVAPSAISVSAQFAVAVGVQYITTDERGELMHFNIKGYHAGKDAVAVGVGMGWKF